MLKKFIAIQNVGKFENCKPTGDVELRALTLVYAENGRGKTTICDILRSLQSGEAGYIVGRRTLGSSAPQEVTVRLDGTNSRYRDGAWEQVFPGLEIYDSTFVHENVYAGDFVDHEHRKALYQVIVGEEGVRLARQLDAIDDESRELARRIGQLKRSIDGGTPPGLTADEIVQLPEVEDLSKKLERKRAQVVALERSDEVLSGRSLQNLALPALPPSLTVLLGKTLEGVSADAEKRVRDHVSSRMDARGESWLSQGLGYVRDEKCPFCDQALSGNDLLTAYQAYFSESYSAFKNEISAAMGEVRQKLGETELLRVQDRLSDNARLETFWRDFVDAELPPMDFNEVRDSIVALREAAEARIAQKNQAPLERLEPGPELEAALATYGGLEAVVRKYNEQLQEVNRRIERKKGETEAGDTATAKRELAELQSAGLRHGALKEACDEYVQALSSKSEIESRRSSVKQQLDEHSDRILNRYQDEINRLLRVFGAGFLIADTRRQYAGGTASAAYRLVINDVTVDLGDATTSADSPCFRNTLSSGDRSTLALAFFLAKLALDADLSQKTVVFDDPFTSQDASRRTCTQQRISRLVGRAKQVIVLSHNPGFLKLVWSASSQESPKALQLFRLGPRNTTISEWDIEEDERSDYFANHNTLVLFRDDGEGDLRGVARAIRPLLEGYLRFKLPRHFASGIWLGDMIAQIRGAEEDSPIAAGKAILEELDEINDYSKRFHHDQNPGGADTETVDSGELRTYVARTLDVVGGF